MKSVKPRQPLRTKRWGDASTLRCWSFEVASTNSSISWPYLQFFSHFWLRHQLIFICQRLLHCLQRVDILCFPHVCIFLQMQGGNREYLLFGSSAGLSWKELPKPKCIGKDSNSSSLFSRSLIRSGSLFSRHLLLLFQSSREHQVAKDSLRKFGCRTAKIPNRNFGNLTVSENLLLSGKHEISLLLLCMNIQLFLLTL